MSSGDTMAFDAVVNKAKETLASIKHDQLYFARVCSEVDTDRDAATQYLEKLTAHLNRLTQVYVNVEAERRFLVAMDTESNLDGAANAANAAMSTSAALSKAVEEQESLVQSLASSALDKDAMVLNKQEELERALLALKDAQKALQRATVQLAAHEDAPTMDDAQVVALEKVVRMLCGVAVSSRANGWTADSALGFQTEVDRDERAEMVVDELARIGAHAGARCARAREVEALSSKTCRIVVDEADGRVLATFKVRRSWATVELEPTYPAKVNTAWVDGASSKKLSDALDEYLSDTTNVTLHDISRAFTGICNQK